MAIRDINPTREAARGLEGAPVGAEGADLRGIAPEPDEPDAPPYPAPAVYDGVVRPADPTAEAGPDLMTWMAQRRPEISALVALTLGTVVLSVLGLIVGGVLVGLSTGWLLRDKLLTLLALPITVLLVGAGLSWLRATRMDPAADTGARIGVAGDGMWFTLQALPLVVGWLGAVYLGYLLLRSPAETPERQAAANASMLTSS